MCGLIDDIDECRIVVEQVIRKTSLIDLVGPLVPDQQSLADMMMANEGEETEVDLVDENGQLVASLLPQPSTSLTHTLRSLQHTPNVPHNDAHDELYKVRWRLDMLECRKRPLRAVSRAYGTNGRCVSSQIGYGVRSV